MEVWKGKFYEGLFPLSSQSFLAQGRQSYHITPMLWEVIYQNWNIHVHTDSQQHKWDENSCWTESLKVHGLTSYTTEAQLRVLPSLVLKASMHRWRMHMDWGGRLRCLYSCLEGGALLFGVLVYESQKNKVAILSQVLLTFLFTQTSSFLYLDEFRQAGNGGFIGARIQNHHFHQQCQLQLLKPHSPGALELPGKLKKRSKKNNSMKNMNLNSCVASQCCVLNIPTATWSKRHLSVELTAVPTAPAPVCRARFYCLCSCATQTGQPGQKTVWW